MIEVVDKHQLLQELQRGSELIQELDPPLRQVVNYAVLVVQTYPYLLAGKVVQLQLELIH